MITLSVLFLFGVGAIIAAMGAGVLSATFKIFGHVVSAGLTVLGFLLMPIAIGLSIAFGIGYLLPFLLPVALVMLVLAMIAAPARA